MDLFAELRALTAALDAAGVDYALCGAVALAIHGVPRATKDIDVLVREEDLDTFSLRSESARDAHARCAHRIRSARSRLRDAAAAPARGRNALGRVARRLITLKLAAARPQDLVDVQRL
ncbi:MAG: hypothetical protein KIT84_39710 [Labilithrix sp.]|nr:hypothetical protein [Labilithrix sp.]MCW5817191.1 hypothetical protein [Labilithrix sp.]